jgi:hypothetical protein
MILVRIARTIDTGVSGLLITPRKTYKVIRRGRRNATRALIPDTQYDLPDRQYETSDSDRVMLASSQLSHSKL